MAFMDLEKAYDRVDRDAMWQVMRIYGIGGRVLKGIMSFFDEGRACVRVENMVSESFVVKMGLRQGWEICFKKNVSKIKTSSSCDPSRLVDNSRMCSLLLNKGVPKTGYFISKY